jgi:DNA-binding transcriptional ArsR family regulator
MAHEEARASDLARRLPVSRSAVSQHLRLMLSVGVVSERREGRERYYTLKRDGLREVRDWLDELDDFWTASPARLAEHLDGGS